MQYFVAKRILGGIAWACASLIVMLSTHEAISQQGYSSPNLASHSTLPPSPQSLPFQPGLSSKDYLRLMAEANARRLAAEPNSSPWSDPTAIRLATTAPQPSIPPTPIPQPSTAIASPLLDPSQLSPPQTFSEQQAYSSHSMSPDLDRATSAHSTVPLSAGNTPGLQPSANPVMRTHPATRSPNFSIAYENVWLRRSGDEGTSWSTGGDLGTFGEDRAAWIRLGWYSNPMERYELGYLGSLVWNRRAEYPQPVNSFLTPSVAEPDWFASFQNSLHHEHFHTATLRSYEWNKRWITDEIGNYFVGLNVIDYEEGYGLRTGDADGAGFFGLTTSNILAGSHGGLEIWHPFSQRLAVGGQGLLGVYGNVAEGTWNVHVENEGEFKRRDRRFQTAAGFGLNAKARYQFTTRLYAFGGYRWWYLAGLATVNDQTIGPLASDTSFDLSTDAGFLLHGATCGLELVF